MVTQLNKFLHRVRIHGGGFDSSARAMNRAGEKGTLITYERAFSAQAEPGIVSGSTIERKKMSTKTIYKRIALVAVATLGAGLLSVAPASAAVTNAMVESISLARVTSSPKTGSPVVVNFGAAIGNVTTATDLDDLVFTGYLSAFPAGGFAGVTANATAEGTDGELAGVTAAVGAQDDTADSATGSNYVVELTDVSELSDNVPSSEGDITASSSQGAGKFSFTPTKVGAYTLTVWFDANANGVINIGEAVQTIDITVAAASGYSAALSTAYMAEDLTDADNTGLATAATDAVDKPLAIRTLGQKAAQIIVTTRDNNNAVYTGQAITATMSGSGFVSAGASAAAAPTAAQADTADGIATTTRTAAVTAAANTTGTVVIGVWGDGTAGTGTVTISVTDKVSGATTTLATKTVTWYSSTAATLEVTALQSIATVGATNGCSNATTCTQATLALTPAFVIVAKDSAGRAIPGLTITGTPTDTAVIASTTVTAVTGGDDENGRGYYNASVTGGAAANSGKKSVITWSTTLADGVTKITTTSEASLGGTPATVTWALDAANYTPGSPVVITVTAKDAAGNPVGDGTYANMFAGATTLGGAITGSTPAASVEIKGGSKTYTAFAPGSTGSFQISNTLAASAGASAGTKLTGAIVVENPEAAAAQDAANEATDAANAATDAALSAADAADAATAAAQDAADAVAALSTRVSKLVSDLRKQIRELTKLVQRLL